MMRAMLAIPEEGAGALGRSMLALARVWDACDREASDLEGRMRAVLEERCPAILAVDGCGPVRGAELAVAAGENPGRIGGEAKFAMLCGAAPIPASSGKTSGRMRLNRGGDRRANRALHTIVVNRMRNDPRTRAYAARRMSGPRPLTKKEVIRCLKRYVAREVFRALTHPCDLPEAVDVGALREARRAAGMSQGEVGRALGVSASSICAVERRRDGTRRLAERYRDWVAEGMPLDGGISEKGACIS